MRQVKKLVGIAFGCMLMASCCPSRTFLVGTNGIVEYNRHTGQLEILWEYVEKPGQQTEKAVCVDSIPIPERK